LTNVLSEREKDLELREEKLTKALKTYEAERSADYGDTGPNDVLHLNVGGTKTTALRRTLTSIPGSMLASKFSGRWDDSLEKDRDGNFFIDQDYALFYPLLIYLRNKANGTEKYSVKLPAINHNQLTVIDFYRMADYYGVTHGIYPTVLQIHTGEENLVEMDGPKKVNAKAWTTFKLVRDAHCRRVKSYEVTLGKVQRMQVGWIYQYNKSVTFKDSSMGVGDLGHTMALDLSRSTFLENGTSTTVDGLEHSEGCAVRSEDYGKRWYVDGKLVAPFSEQRWTNTTQDWTKNWNVNAVHHMHPMISVKGEMEITCVEFDD